MWHIICIIPEFQRLPVSLSCRLTICDVAEVVAFGLGAFSTMPAVRNFSVCAALAVLLDFCLQVNHLSLWIPLRCLKTCQIAASTRENAVCNQSTACAVAYANLGVC